ncbi:hypothetical protein RIF29_38208 [Crotalaria pallida]|uniref:Uncharacterized protein n=1 Tax=Crotalaria pallida TaxID=3830 RepID=A0AAN9E1T7_CROPI
MKALIVSFLNYLFHAANLNFLQTLMYESISELPVVEITIEEIKKSKFNSMIGLVDHERVDAALYDDYETEKAREVRYDSVVIGLHFTTRIRRHVNGQAMLQSIRPIDEKTAVQADADLICAPVFAMSNNTVHSIIFKLLYFRGNICIYDGIPVEKLVNSAFLFVHADSNQLVMTVAVENLCQV